MKSVKSEFDAFDETMGKLLSLPHEELKRRMDAYKEAAAQNPNKRGPKSKVKQRASASRAAKRT